MCFAQKKYCLQLCSLKQLNIRVEGKPLTFALSAARNAWTDYIFTEEKPALDAYRISL